MERDSAEPTLDRRRLSWGVLLWVAVMVGVSVLVAWSLSRHPTAHTVTGAYRSASLHWWAGKDIYGKGIGGFLYLPQSAILYSPFALAPVPLGDVIWRCVCLAVLAFAVYRLSQLLSGILQRPDTFFWLTLITLPMLFGNSRNGQMNLMLAGLQIIAFGEVAERRWWNAAATLALAVAFKPLAMVPALLVGLFHFRAMWWRLAITFLIMLGAPFLFQRPDYVAFTYAGFLQKMHGAGAAVTPQQFGAADLGGLLDSIGLYPGHAVFTVIRGVGALVTLWLGWRASKLRDRRSAALMLLALSSMYLLLFNPRTEGLTYVVAAPIVAALALLAWQDGRRRAAWALTGLNVLWAVQFELINDLLRIVHAVDQISQHTHVPFHAVKCIWLTPLTALVFSVYLCTLLLRGERPWAAAAATRDGRNLANY